MSLDNSDRAHRYSALDIRHLVVRPPDVHPGQANGVVGVARELVREQRGAGEHAQLIMIAHAGLSSDAADLVPDPAVPTTMVPLKGVAVRGRIVRLSQDVVETLLSGSGANTIFHIHGGREPLLAGVARALRRHSVPYALTLHGRFSHIYDAEGRCQKPRSALYAKLVERGMLQGARFVQALSAHEGAVLRQIAPRARIEIVGNGAYSSRFGSIPVRPAARPRSASFPHFVFCGRYAIPHKGLDLLVEGFARYRREGGVGRLTTIGSGPGRDELAAMAQSLGVADAAVFGGPLFGDVRDKALQACDFFVMASRFEGIPLAALEAALLGMPLMLTVGTGLRAEVVAHGAGIPIEATTAKAVCAAMHRAEALSAAEWTASAASAFALAIAIGDWTMIARRLRELYEAPTRVARSYGQRLAETSA